MFCANCLKRIEDGARFCTGCGAAVVKSNQATDGSCATEDIPIDTPVPPMPSFAAPKPTVSDSAVAGSSMPNPNISDSTVPNFAAPNSTMPNSTLSQKASLTPPVGAAPFHQPTQKSFPTWAVISIVACAVGALMLCGILTFFTLSNMGGLNTSYSFDDWDITGTESRDSASETLEDFVKRIERLGVDLDTDPEILDSIVGIYEVHLSYSGDDTEYRRAVADEWWIEYVQFTSDSTFIIGARSDTDDFSDVLMSGAFIATRIDFNDIDSSFGESNRFFDARSTMREVDNRADTDWYHLTIFQNLSFMEDDEDLAWLLEFGLEDIFISYGGEGDIVIYHPDMLKTKFVTKVE